MTSGDFSFLSKFSCLRGDQKRERESRYRLFSESDFPGKQRKHLSEQNGERPTEDSGSSHLGKPLPSQALT